MKTIKGSDYINCYGICKFPECENWTYRPDVDWCETHRRANEKEKEVSKKQSEKKKALLQKAKEGKPRKQISRNPKDWKNKGYCSDGTKIGQKEINDNLRRSYSISNQGVVCAGCGTGATSHAHIIAQSRCKEIRKTELIWNPQNYFPSCFACNSAIENPKGKEWKRLKNIEKCLSFIKQHDPELYTKFETSATNQEKQTI